MLFQEYFDRDVRDMVTALEELVDAVERSDELGELIQGREEGLDDIGSKVLDFRAMLLENTERSKSSLDKILDTTSPCEGAIPGRSARGR